MSVKPPTALIAEDEPLLRKSLERLLVQAWPELLVVARAGNGRQAIDLFDAHQPDVCFLDVHMPGVTGIEAAQYIGRRAHLVFVTAFDQYAVQAFAHGVLDYLVKPVDGERLKETVGRLQERLRSAVPAIDPDALLRELVSRVEQRSTLRWIKASVGQTVTVIGVDDIDFLRADEKYTVVAWRDESGTPREAIVRAPLKELVAQLDRNHFAQVHRSVVVNLRAVAHVIRGDNETGQIHLKGRADVLPVSRSYLPIFRQM